MVKKLGYVLSLLVLSCQVSQERVQSKALKIKGQIEHPQAHGFVYLYLLDGVGRKQIAKVKPTAAGFFELEVRVSQPTFFQISFYGIQDNILVVDEEDVALRAHGGNTFGYFKVEQSVENERLAAWLGLVKFFPRQTGA